MRILVVLLLLVALCMLVDCVKDKPSSNKRPKDATAKPQKQKPGTDKPGAVASTSVKRHRGIALPVRIDATCEQQLGATVQGAIATVHSYSGRGDAYNPHTMNDGAELGRCNIEANGQCTVRDIAATKSSRIYAKVTLDNDRFTLNDGAGSSPIASARSTELKQQDKSGALVVVKVTISALYCEVYNGFSSIITWSVDSLGFALNKVTVEFPALHHTSRAQLSKGRILLNLRDGNRKLVMAHEYAHWLMYNKYNQNYYAPGGIHRLCDANPQDPLLTFGEGYADAFALIYLNQAGTMQANPWNIYGNHPERYQCASSDAATDEGRFAAAVWDLFDSCADYSVLGLNRGRSGYGDAAVNAYTAKQLLFDALAATPKTATDYFDSVIAIAPAASSNLDNVRATLAYNYGSYTGMSNTAAFELDAISKDRDCDEKAQTCNYMIRWDRMGAGPYTMWRTFRGSVATTIIGSGLGNKGNRGFKVDATQDFTLHMKLASNAGNLYRIYVPKALEKVYVPNELDDICS